MSLESADNAYVTDEVASLKAIYTQYQTSLRGAAAESLAGLSDGTLTMLNMTAGISDLTRSFLHSTENVILEALGNTAERALQTSLSSDSPDVPLGTQDVIESLVRAFAQDLEKDLDVVGGKTLRMASDFVVQQQIAGRAFATSDQLAHDLEFTMKDAAGRNLAVGDFFFRQVNWAFRTLYNTVMVHVLLNKGIDEAEVDGGSKAGTTLDLNNFDKVAPTYFHHNSKSLLKPLD